MTERAWTTVDKARWPRGLWDAEPDKVQWRDAATGLPCLAVRNHRSGIWCGYVGVYPEHRWHGVQYNACLEQPPCGEDDDCDYGHRPEGRAEVHGGLTFSDRCDPVAATAEGQGICHVPEPGEPEPWWFGFDCGHAWDVCPAYPDLLPRSTSDEGLPRMTYRALPFVRQECADLAGQLKAIR